MDTKAREIITRLNKKLGDGIVVLGSDVRIYPRVPSGSLGLDYILGGGWPVNQWHEILGEHSAGKTNLAFATISANQRRDPEWTAAWVAAESFVPEWAERSGIDLSRIIVCETHVMEEAYEAIIDLAESRAVDGIVVDSLPTLVPIQEDEKDMDESTVGRGALLTGKFFRKVGKAMRRSLVEDDRAITGWMINQYRMKIGVLHGDPRTTPGGEAKNYSYFSRVEVKRDAWIETGKGDGKERVGQTNRVTTIKNKTSRPQKKAYYDLYFDNGGPVPPGQIDYGKEAVTMAALLDVVQRSGAWYYYADRQWQGKEALIQAVREEPDLRDAIESQVIEIMGRR